MRIVYVLTSLGMGGAERQAMALAERMQQRGHAVLLLVLRPPLPEQWSTELAVVHLGLLKNPVSLLVSLARGCRVLWQFQPDLIHSHSFHANLIARCLRLCVSRLALISTIHNVYEGGWIRMLLYRLTDPLADSTTAVSHAAADRFIALKAVDPSRCLVVANGIDTSSFAANAERRAQTRVGNEGRFVWLAMGRVVAAKDYPNLLEAFARVRIEWPRSQLWIAGATDTEEAEIVRKDASERGWSEGVRWLGLRRDGAALLDAADAFVLSSAWEGMPLAVGEAMAMQKVVVATDVGGVRELVGEAGLLVPPHAPRMLAEAMIQVMCMKAEERTALGNAARQRIVAQFSFEAKAVEWETLYQHVLEQNR